MEDRELISQQFKSYLEGTAAKEEAEQLLWFLYTTGDEAFVEQLIADNWETERIESIAEDILIRRRLEQSRLYLRDRIAVPQRRTKIPVFKLLLYSTAIAAACLAIIFGNFWLLRQDGIRIIAVSASAGQIKKVLLPDSSVVTLNAGTTLEYPSSFSSDSRSVALKNGQAFFEVKHHQNLPFIVQTAEAKVTVLGTSFDIKSYSNDEQTRVAVATGMVGVQTNGRNRPSTPLKAGELATINNQNNGLLRTSLPAGDIAGWRSNRLSFREEPFLDVIHALERRYQVKIKIEKQTLLKEKITLSLDNESLETALKALSLSNHFNYQIHEHLVLVK
ncbi:FecR domain-containing protein [Pedobacter sp. KR3-3]|uniref:FecR domain-containing protein n=1 Tax=Pedobacter albus TaxID=3113905 RepID=A0ABU7IAN5_9SPHI|nr:FecR domain-containing protein [Pedobacter sp. KR3-3]MEE1946431.1 FecR domain-containing protein [Pedobacter sp. KR3-3]